MAVGRDRVLGFLFTLKCDFHVHQREELRMPAEQEIEAIDVLGEHAVRQADRALRLGRDTA